MKNSWNNPVFNEREKTELLKTWKESDLYEVVKLIKRKYNKKYKKLSQKEREFMDYYSRIVWRKLVFDL